MKPLSHFIFGIIFSLLLFLIFPKMGLLGFLLIVFSSVLIDFDHYVYYVLRKKDFSLKNAYNWFIQNEQKYLSLSSSERKQIYPSLCLIHTFEFLILFALLIFYSHVFLFILTGFIFHLFLDFVYAVYSHVEGHDISAVYNCIKSRRLKHIEDI
jgi:hypothetical protein